MSDGDRIDYYSAQGAAAAGVISTVMAPEALLFRGASAVWRAAPFARGLAIEAKLGGNLPSAFPVIDRFEKGVATSIKSLDLNAKTYQNASALTSKLNDYISKLAGFNGASFSGRTIKSSQISSRVLEVAVPKGSMTAAQQGAIDAATKTAEKYKVTRKIIGM